MGTPLPQKGAEPPIFFRPISCGQMAGWIKMPLGRAVGLSQSDIVRWGPSSPSPTRRRSPQFSTHAYCGQTAGWMKIPLGTEVDLSPGHIVLNWVPAPSPQKGHSNSPLFSAHMYCGHGRPSQLLLSSSWLCVHAR